MTTADPQPMGRASIWGPLGGDFGIRLVSALVLFGLALVIVWLGSWVFAAWVAFACAVMGIEWERMTQAPFSWTGLSIGFSAITIGCVLMELGKGGFALAAIGAGALAAALHAVTIGRHWLWAGAMPLYLGIPSLILIWQRGAEQGFVTVLWFLFVVWATDSLAMIVGRVLKGPLMAPVLSPKKTWSGAFGGLIGAMGIGAIYCAVAHRTPDLPVIAAMAAISLVAQAGDVAESAIKRRFSTKDAGLAIPGHGGFLDRMDGMLAATLVLAGLGAFWPGFPFGGGA